MKSRIGQLAAAAVIVIAVLLALQVWSPLGSSVTFAQAIQPILNANTAVLDIIIGVEGPNTPVIHDMVTGSRIRRTLSNVPDVISVIDLETGRILTLEESKKEAAYIDLKGLPSIPNYLDKLKSILIELQNNPRFVVEDLGAREIEGREAVGFLARHPRVKITLWADSHTGLPVRIESKEGQLNVIIKNLQFDVPMHEAMFSMDVPGGYELQQDVELDLLGSTEADFIEGLRVLAETFGDGQFPDGVALEDYLRQAPDIQKQTEELGLSSEEETALGTKLQKYLLFLRFFKGEGKWYYRGQGVKLGQAEVPIFWYRPVGSETYRVIHGDLHGEDVRRENLPEPLDADDVAPAALGYQAWSKPDFVGMEEDLWRIQAGGQVTVQSDLRLMKGPEGVSTMPITLPYATGVLTSVSLASSPVPFRSTGPGRYELQLPLEILLAGKTKITCTWTLPLADLQATEYGYDMPLRSLIPVVSLKVKAALDPDSGFELTEPAKSLQHPSERWVLLCTMGSPEPKTDFGGACGITVQKRN